MKNKKRYLTLDENLYLVLIFALNRFRNKLIEADHCSDAIDEILIKTFK